MPKEMPSPRRMSCQGEGGKEAIAFIYEINYDLIEPGKNYPELIAAIKNLGSWCHVLKSTWLIDTDLSLNDVHDAVKQFTDITDAYWIYQITSVNYWIKGSEAVRTWIKQHIG